MEVTLAPGLLSGDAALLERAVGNLADNALRHNVPGGTVWITADAEDGRAFLTVANTGPDIHRRRSTGCCSPSSGAAKRATRTVPAPVPAKTTAWASACRSWRRSPRPTAPTSR